MSADFEQMDCTFNLGKRRGFVALDLVFGHRDSAGAARIARHVASCGNMADKRGSGRLCGWSAGLLTIVSFRYHADYAPHGLGQRSCGRFQRGCSAGTRSSVCHCRAICHRRGVGACLPTIGEVRFNMVQAGKRPCLRGHGGGSRAGIGPALSDARRWRRTQLATGSCWKLRCLLDRRPTVRVRPQRGAASVFAHKG